MTTVPRSILEHARDHHGLVTLDCLSRHGVSRHTRARFVRNGLLEPVHSGVYRVGGRRASFEQRCLAACLASPLPVVSGTSAGRLLGLRRMPDGPVHVMTAGQKLELDGVVVHRTTTLGPGDIRHRPDGTRVLAPARLVPDLARFLDDTDLESVIEQLLDRSATSIPSLLASARRLRVTGRDGIVRLARVLDSRPPWMKPKDSGLEVRVLGALAARGVVLEPQYSLDIGDDHPIHFDGADPERRMGVEIDHVTWHGGRIATQRDKTRDRRAARLGWLVVRVTDDDVTNDFTGTIDDLVAIHRQRCLAATA